MVSIDLYQKLREESTHEPLSIVLPQVLRFAHAIGDESLAQWARLEMDGYTSRNRVMSDVTAVPEYRTVVGQHMNVLDQCLYIDDPDLTFLNEDRLRWGVGELERLVNTREIVDIQNPAMNHLIREHLHVEVYKFRFSSTEIVGVLSRIRSKLVDSLERLSPRFVSSEAARKVATTTPSAPAIRSQMLAKVKEHSGEIVAGVITSLLAAFLAFLFGWV